MLSIIGLVVIIGFYISALIYKCKVANDINNYVHSLSNKNYFKFLNYANPKLLKFLVRCDASSISLVELTRRKFDYDLEKIAIGKEKL